MRKANAGKKLVLKNETLRNLQAAEMARVAGGSSNVVPCTAWSCFLTACAPCAPPQPQSNGPKPCDKPQ